MKRIGGLVRMAVAVALVPAMLVQQGSAWGHDGHSMINRLAVANLPTDVPAFLRSKAAQDAMDYYGPQPDRWRSADQGLYATLVPEHDIDLEWADLAGPLPRRRYEYTKALAAAQDAHPEIEMVPQNVGLLPYATNEHYIQLLSAMRDYRGLMAAKQDTKPIEAEIVFLAGTLGHFVADGSEPLHTTIYYNGWVGDNPNGYTTEKKIHAVFEGDFVHNNLKVGDVAPLVAATKPVLMKDEFDDFMTYLRHSNSLVGRTYDIEKAGGFVGKGSAEAKEFTAEQVAAGAIELRDMIYTAWVRSADPVPVSHFN